MGTPGERKALLFFATAIALGGGVRAVRAIDNDATIPREAREAIDRQISTVDSVRKNKKGKGRRPKKPDLIVPAIIDLDIATEEQVETLRGIGPALAKRIVADRDSLGPFGSLDGLTRVKGVGPKLAAKVAANVTFSLLPRPSATESSGYSASPSGRRRPRPGDTQ